MSAVFDLAVIGAGIVGSVLADQAASRHPDWKILLLDRSQIGSGSTLHSGGHNHPWAHHGSVRDLMVHSVGYYEQLGRRFPASAIAQRPLLGIVAERNLARVSAGYVHHPVDRVAAHDRSFGSAGLLRVSEGQCVIQTTSGYGYPSQITNELVRHLRVERGVVCWEGVEVRQLSASASGTTLRTACDRELTAKRVVCTSGPWLPSLMGHDVARQRGLRVKKVVAMHLDLTPSHTDPIIYFFDHDAYLLPLVERGHWVLSFTSPHWDVSADGPLQITAEDRAVALGVLDRYSPDLAARCQSGRVHCDVYCESRVPFAVELPWLPEVVIATGCSGFGFRLAPGLGALALNLLERRTG